MKPNATSTTQANSAAEARRIGRLFGEHARLISSCAFADILEEFIPKFNRAAFLLECGIEERWTDGRN